eukprot:981132_1
MSGENTDPRLVETQEEKDRLQREFDALDVEYRNSLRRSSAERINSGSRDMDENALSTHNLETDAKFSVQDSALPNIEPDVVEFCVGSCPRTKKEDSEVEVLQCHVREMQTDHDSKVRKQKSGPNTSA